MAERDRKALICEQTPPPQVTGIDFVRVVDPEVQTRLEVFFVVDPNTLDDPFDILSAPPPGFARIDAVEDDSTVAIAALSWDQVPDAQGGLRTVLVIDTEQPGGFQIYRLTLTDDHVPSRIDPFFNAVEFSFKQGCPSDFDCKPRHECPEVPSLEGLITRTPPGGTADLRSARISDIVDGPFDDLAHTLTPGSCVAPMAVATSRRSTSICSH